MEPFLSAMANAPGIQHAPILRVLQAGNPLPQYTQIPLLLSQLRVIFTGSELHPALVLLQLLNLLADISELFFRLLVDHAPGPWRLKALKEGKFIENDTLKAGRLSRIS
jgi:hypothetical protein